MFKSVLLMALFCFHSALSAQTPSKAVLVLSLKTMSKAPTGCREVYSQHSSETQKPMLRAIIGDDDYQKDLNSLGHSETFVNFLIAHPDRTTGKLLVAIVSSSDDFSVGVGSTRAELLRHVILDSSDATPLIMESEALNNCQKNLFNAGDDFVELVMTYVGAEDDALAGAPTKRKGPTR